MPSEDPYFWPNREAINVEYNEGDVISVPQHDGSSSACARPIPSTTRPIA